MKKIALAMGILSAFNLAFAGSHGGGYEVDQSVIDAQNAKLDMATEGKGYGPQSPRDISKADGMNARIFSPAPAASQLNLCNIHMHLNAEHRGGQFTDYAGPGDGKGFHTGYKYTGHLSKAEATPLGHEVCPSDHGSLQVGDTIEVHYVHTSAMVEPGPTLGACMSDIDKNPQLRVQAQVMVLVNDNNAADFGDLVMIGHNARGYHQAVHMPDNTGKAVEYEGSTTGPSYDEQASPFQVSWTVKPNVIKVYAESVDQWCRGNVFKEDHAHGVRNLVVNPQLLSQIH